MKRTYNLTVAVLLALFAGGFASCVSDDTGLKPDIVPGDSNGRSLVINYNIDFPDEVSTYASPEKPTLQIERECKVEDIYILYFYPSDDPNPTNRNKYAGYTRTGTIKSGGDLPINKGSATVTVPGNLTLDQEMQLIVLANFDNFAYKFTYNSIEEMLEGKLTDMLFEDAKKELKLVLQDTKGFEGKALPMSAVQVKDAASKSVSVKFKRRVARIDVENAIHPGTKDLPEGEPSFKLLSARIYNANIYGWATDAGGTSVISNNGSDYIKYEDQVVQLKDNNKEIKGRLYSFPNFITAPTLQDQQTTCLIIGGIYQGDSKETYYRINVTPKEPDEAKPYKEQRLLANGLYTIRITKVHGSGSDTPDEAYDADELKLDYIINEWDDSLLGTHSFDEYGNALSVSHRNVSFSNAGGQQLPIQVYTKQSNAHPISTPWSVSLEQLGDVDYTDKFEIVEDQANNQFYIKTKEANTSMTDWVAYAKVSWGGIDIYISLTQLSPYSTLKGITVFPKDLIVINESSTRKLGVNTQGNFDGLDISHITHSIMYSDDSNTGWITDVRPSAPQTQLDQGIYYFDVDIKAQEANATSRTAIIKFVVKNGKHIASAEASITQSPTKFPEENNEGLTINMYLYNKEPQAGQQPEYIEKKRSDIVGLSPALSEWSEENSLLFSQAPADQIYYHLYITSDFDWQIETDKNTGANLKFEIESIDDPSGKTKTTTLKVSASKDAPHAWAGDFKIKYENGSARTFYAAQEGVYRQFTDATDSPVHFYGIINYRNQLWLDRNLGDLKSAKYDNAVYANVNNEWYSHNTKVNDIRELNRNCPPGWALPNATEALNFVESIRNNNGTLQVLTSLPTTDGDAGGANDPNSKSKYYDLSKSPQYLGGANDKSWHGSPDVDSNGTSSANTFSIATSNSSTYVHVLFNVKNKRKMWTTTKIGTSPGSINALNPMWNSNIGYGNYPYPLTAFYPNIANMDINGISNMFHVRCIRKKITEQP